MASGLNRQDEGGDLFTGKLFQGPCAHIDTVDRLQKVSFLHVAAFSSRPRGQELSHLRAQTSESEQGKVHPN